MPSGRLAGVGCACLAAIVALGAPAAAAAPAANPASPANLAPAGSGPGASGAGAGAAAPPAPLPASIPNPELSVLDQSPWLTGPSGTFTMGLLVGPVPSGPAYLQVSLYPRLVTRTYFDESLRGQMTSPSLWRSQPVPVTSLPADPGPAGAGGVRIYLPVNPSSTPPAGALPGVYLGSQNGVYPVQVTVVDASGNTVGQPLTTYLVWVPAPTGFPKLAVSWVLPVQAPPALPGPGQPASLPADTVGGLTAELDA
ncbi:MAG: hypothetical protein ACRDY0_05340, partial [Acidimicrobiales bacterium]